MTISDFVFLVSLLLAICLVVAILIATARRRWTALRRLLIALGLFVGIHTATLVAMSLVTPRRTYARGERRCFDDWCVTLRGMELPPGGEWIATVEVFSDAKRVRQRARDAYAELEDSQGRRYAPAARTSPALSDELGPGESFVVKLPFRLPAGASPAGLLVHHGEYPGKFIIGADESLLHPPALHR